MLVVFELLPFVVFDPLELLLDTAEELLVEAFRTRIISKVMFVLFVPLVELLEGTFGSEGRVELSSRPER